MRSKFSFFCGFLMTSILTNSAAISALQTLRSISSGMENAQRAVSTGLRITSASDNAAYWSISTTMRSDHGALSAVSDALGLGAAKVDVAYAGMDSTIDVLSEFHAKLVAAKESGVDKGKIQTELDQLKEQLLSIAESASFNGVNWLKTNAPENLWELSSLPTSITSSFIRSADGSVRVGTTNIELADISLFNAGGGGALQKDPRSLGDIGGLRNTDITAAGFIGYVFHPFSGGFTLDTGDNITIEILVNDNQPISAGALYSLVVDRAAVDAALGTNDGIISSQSDYSRVLSYIAYNSSIPVTISSTVPGSVGILTQEIPSQPGSSVAVTNVSSSFPPGNFGGGFENAHTMRSSNRYAFESFSFTGPFTVHRDVSFSFDIQVATGDETTVTVDRAMVDAVLGDVNGVVGSASNMAELLNHALGGHGLVVTTSGPQVVFEIDKSIYPNAGSRSHFRLGNASGSVGAEPDFDILDVNITVSSSSLDNYLSGVDSMLQKVISGASALGAVKTRIDMQESFAQSLVDSISKGIGRLVDADMNDASTRLKALQTQQQLGIQSLQIANSEPESILALFR